MTTIASGSSLTLTSPAKGMLYRLTSYGAVGKVTGAQTMEIGPAQTTYYVGPLDVGQSVTVTSRVGQIEVSYGYRDITDMGPRGFAHVRIDRATGMKSLLSPEGVSIVGGVASSVDPMTATLSFSGVVYLRSQSGMGSWMAPRLIDTSTIPSITNPLGRWYAYTATDHETRGGVRLLYADNLEGPWAIYTGGPATSNIIYEDLDQSGSGTCDSTETPMPIYDPVLGKMRLTYHCRTPNYGGTPGTKTNVSDPNGGANNATYYGFGQGTMCAVQHSSDTQGVLFTKDRDWRLSVSTTTGPLGAGDHTGYMSVYPWRGRYIAHHLLGGGSTSCVGRSFATDMATWTVSNDVPGQFGDIVALAGYPGYGWNWLNAQPFETAGGPVVIARMIEHDGSGVVYAAARFDGELNQMIGAPRVLDTTGYKFSNWVQNDDGRLVALAIKEISGDTEMRIAYLG